MMGRGIRVSLTGVWSGRRVVGLPIGLALIWALSRLTNPWDLLLYTTLDSEIALILIPMFLFLLHRDLQHPAEALAAIRLGKARTWWATHVASAGISALIMAAMIGVFVVIVPLATHGWSWHWGPNAHLRMNSAILSSPGWRIPWRWGIEALGLLTLGLWSMGVLMYALALWWRAPWVAWIVVVSLGFGSEALEGTAMRPLLWGIPGVQYSLALHWAGQHVVPPYWSIVYALALLAVAVGVGLVITDAAPWDSTHGGTL